MSTLQQIQQWSATHHPRWLVVLRVALGLSLFAKGISFVDNNAALDQLIAGSFVSNAVHWLPLTITSAHLLGGFLIIIGLLTRWAALFQIPILAGAVIFISRQSGSFSLSEFIFALVILALLVFFLFEGGGPISLDNYFKRHPK